MMKASPSQTVKKAKLTGQIVHTLLVTAMRSEIKSQLEQFSLQLLHEEFNFTAYGFFTLDFTLLHTMMGTTASYLFILIQFR
ncbi:putative gustatory receptor 28b [Neodiprion lecontei]|uniref:Gustatory receptor 28b n=1 Tax=Neodiprion lecontei TaxID=441921 RepID=A0ABM3FKE8_NEOLC|nr:putative gustatory receptor 28b [Neodiprion lecontei]